MVLISCFIFPFAARDYCFSLVVCVCVCVCVCVLGGVKSLENEVMNLDQSQEVVYKSDKLLSQFLKTCTTFVSL